MFCLYFVLSAVIIIIIVSFNIVMQYAPSVDTICAVAVAAGAQTGLRESLGELPIARTDGVVYIIIMDSNFSVIEICTKNKYELYT
jgi:hypothetical protein